MKVFITSGHRLDNPDSWFLGSYRFLKSSSEFSKHHSVVNCPKDADIVLFTDTGRLSCGLSLFKNRILLKHFHKVFVCNTEDRPLPLFPGLYASLSHRAKSQKWCLTGMYTHESSHHAFPFLPFNPNARYLYSFAGTCLNAKVRQDLLKINSPRFHLVDTSRRVQSAFTQGDEAEIRRLRSTLQDSCLNSIFVLCPRGRGTGSIRLFEVMRMGRVPVILSDDWIPIEGIDWNSCSLRYREDQLFQLDSLLEAERPKAAQLAYHARKVWETHFSHEASFDTVVNLIARLHPLPRTKRVLITMMHITRLLTPHYFRTFLRLMFKN